jgi:hypothetical protein
MCQKNVYCWRFLARAVFGDNHLAFIKQEVALRLINRYHILINEGMKCFSLYTDYIRYTESCCRSLYLERYLNLLWNGIANSMVHQTVCWGQKSDFFSMYCTSYFLPWCKYGMTKQHENITELVLCITDVCLQLCVAFPLLPPCCANLFFLGIPLNNWQLYT